MPRRKRIWVGGPARHPICCAGPPDHDVCHNLSFLEAKESEFHDRALIDATREINAIFTRLGELPPDTRPPRTHLALLNTGVGLLLVWAEDGPRPRDIARLVTYDSPEDDIREALGLEEEPAAKGAPSAEA